jgi:DNA-binding LacI/PurR family transcriptional regulator
MKQTKAIYINIAETLKQRIVSDDGGGFIPSESALQTEFEVSRVTIRKSLKLLEERGYIRTVPGRGRIVSSTALPIPLNRRKQKNIACVYTSSQPCFGISANSFMFSARKAGYGCPVYFLETKSGIERFVDELSPENYSGIAGIGQINKDIAVQLYRKGLPVVFIGSDNPVTLDSFCTDNYSGGYMAAEHLLKHGHHNVIAFGPWSGHEEYNQRISGLKDGYAQNSASHNIATVDIDAHDLSGIDINAFSAAFVSSDLYLRNFFKLTGLPIDAVPGRISIVGYDNFINNFEPTPLRTDSIEQPWEKMADLAFKQLKSMIEEPAHTSHIKMKVRPILKKYGTVTKTNTPQGD